MIELRTKQNNILIGYFDNIAEVQEYWSWSQLYDDSNSYIINK